MKRSKVFLTLATGVLAVAAFAASRTSHTVGYISSGICKTQVALCSTTPSTLGNCLVATAHGRLVQGLTTVKWQKPLTKAN